MISIITPTFNRAALLPRAIESMQKQTCKTWELVIVNDGSTDNTDDIIKPYLEDSRIRYIKKENSGASHSRNVGVDQASFAWITFLDSDDEAGVYWIEKLLKAFQNGSRAVSCGLTKVDAVGNEIETIIPQPRKGIFLSGAYALEKNTFQQIGGFDFNLPSGQHTDLFLRLKRYLKENKIELDVIPESLVKVHIHGGERIRNSYDAKYSGTLLAYNNKDYLKWSKPVVAKSRYESILAYNAFKLGKHAEARAYGMLSFKTKPSLLELARLIRYYLRVF